MKILSRLERLDQLESWLKSDDALILRDAAQELGVSLRTIHRDLDLLRDRGVPVEAERGRGGGVRVSTGWGIGRVSLTRMEALDLLVGLAIGDAFQGAFQMGHSGAIRRKLMGTFSHADQRKITEMRRRVRLGVAVSPAAAESLRQTHDQIGDRIKEAFTLTRIIEIAYRDGQGHETERSVEIHFLLLSPPIWYAITWDHTRNDIRFLRCDRMERLVVTNVPFTPRPWEDFADLMKSNPTREV